MLEYLRGSILRGEMWALTHYIVKISKQPKADQALSTITVSVNLQREEKVEKIK
jgi:hypothetical protein